MSAAATSAIPAAGSVTAPAAATPAIGVADLAVDLGGTSILRGVDLEVARGEWVTMIGPNGAGKSTMLRAVGGLLPFRGSVSLFGTPLGQLSRRARARRVAVVAQNPVVPPGVVVLDYVLLGRVPYLPMLGRESSVDLDLVWRTLDRMSIAGFAGRPLETLSGGERQRVFLARAIVQGADLLLLDEPTTALDIGHQQEVLELVDELRRCDGLSVLATMHDLSIAGEYADRMVLLAQGRSVAAGSPGEVLTEKLLAEYYGATVRVIETESGPLVVPVRERPTA